MYSENGVLVDFEEISRVVNNADVFTLGFANFPERLIVDTRTDEREGPLVQVVEPAGSPRDRIAWLYRRRPSLGLPKAFSFIAWPHSPGFLAQSGIWDRILRRVDAGHDHDVRVQCELALRQLQNLDHEASLAILKGDRCVTLWPKEPGS